MECSVCGDVSFQIYLFRCTKCSIRFQHQYCSRAYYENLSVESIREVCDWCFSIQEEDEVSDEKLITRDSDKRKRSSAGFGERTNMTHKRKGNKNLRKPCVEIDGQISKFLKEKERPESTDSTKRKNRKRYKLLDEILS
ncbi:hypothetical protein SUGI_1134160 [Cryptomeria japonica]|nr:hypothetical protein SUGI_1134160 [Cryptomeria japonica]